MSSKQNLRLPINVARRLCMYLRTASALAAQGRCGATGSNLLGHRQELEHLLIAKEEGRDILQPETTSQAYD